MVKPAFRSLPLEAKAGSRVVKMLHRYELKEELVRTSWLKTLLMLLIPTFSKQLYK